MFPVPFLGGAPGRFSRAPCVSRTCPAFWPPACLFSGVQESPFPHLSTPPTPGVGYDPPTHRGNRTKCQKMCETGTPHPRGPNRSPKSSPTPPCSPDPHPTRPTRPTRPVAPPIPELGSCGAPSPPFDLACPPKGSPCAHEQRTHPRSPAPTLPSQSPVCLRGRLTQAEHPRTDARPPI